RTASPHPGTRRLPRRVPGGACGPAAPWRIIAPSRHRTGSPPDRRAEATPMPYAAEISRANPTCFLFLIDQSKSLTAPLGGQGKTKADAVAASINRLLYTLVLRCVWGQAVLDRFHVGVIGYGRTVVAALGGPLAGRELVPISEVARNPLRVEQRVQKVDD